MRHLLSRLFGEKPLDLSDPRVRELPEHADPPMFVYIRIPAEIGPVERGERFEDPLEVELRRTGFGEITGGGSLLTAPDSDGRRRIQYCGIDVDLVKPREGIALLLSKLQRLRAPKGTVLEFSIEGTAHELTLYDS